jgi:hypothetical protein
MIINVGPAAAFFGLCFVKTRRRAAGARGARRGAALPGGRSAGCQPAGVAASRAATLVRSREVKFSRERPAGSLRYDRLERRPHVCPFIEPLIASFLAAK